MGFYHNLQSGVLLKFYNNVENTYNKAGIFKEDVPEEIKIYFFYNSLTIN